MRQVYALLGLVKKWGPARVETACASALAHEQVNVGLIGRMLERGTESALPCAPPASGGTMIAGRFARDPGHFTVKAPNRPHPSSSPPPSRGPEAIVEAAFAAALAEDAQ